MRENKISVVINTYNAQTYLDQVLESVRQFDEIVICDMESTDATISIAEKHHCKIVNFPKANHKIVEPARTFAIQSASYPWILVVDADEIVSEKLRVTLYRHISQEHAAEGVYIPRTNLFMGKYMNCAFPDYQLRFFIREDTTWPPYVHTIPKIKGLTKRLPKDKSLAFAHLANDNIHSIIEKDNRYSDDDVEKKAKKNYGLGALIGRPFWRIFKCYILEGGFKDGTRGLIYALLKGQYQFFLVSKIIEKRLTQPKIRNV